MGEGVQIIAQTLDADILNLKQAGEEIMYMQTVNSTEVIKEWDNFVDTVVKRKTINGEA